MSKKKKISIVLILLLLISVLSTYMINSVYAAYTYNKINTTILSTGHTVYIGEEDMDFPHLYCVQRGRDVVSGEYTIGGIKYVEDPKLAYVLANTNMNSTERYWASGRQIALWRYLYENSSSNDAKNMRNYGRVDYIKPVVCNTGDGHEDCTISSHRAKSGLCIYQNHWDDSESILNAADTYASTITNCSISISEPEIDGNTIVFNMTGTYDEFEIKINGTEITKYTKSGSKITIEDISSISGSTIELEVIPYKTMYEVGYRVLTKSDSQRLIVISSLNRNGKYEGAVARKTITLETNVSLQKYITKVESATGDVKYDNATERKNKYAKTGMNSEYNHSGFVISNISGE